MIENSRIFITGGAGYLGKHIIKQYYDNNDITIYSRDESKHYFLKKTYPNIKCVVGDIRDYDLLKRKSKNHDIGIFAASLKQIEACDENPEEAVKIIIDGALNSRRVSIENEFKCASFISTDKSRSATTIYGAMKYVAGESFILNNDSDTKLSTVIYGNVLNSTGSIIPLIWSAIKNNIEIPLYSNSMTRFAICVDDAINLIERSLNFDGVNIIPNIKSINILDLFEIYSEKFKLKYSIKSPRIGEKIHEIMASSEEIPRLKFHSDFNLYSLHPKIHFNELTFKDNEYSSKNFVLAKSELIDLLESYDYFRQ
jgi:UDP-glucose 4-epimerase